MEDCRACTGSRVSDRPQRALPVPDIHRRRHPGCPGVATQAGRSCLACPWDPFASVVDGRRPRRHLITVTEVHHGPVAVSVCDVLLEVAPDTVYTFSALRSTETYARRDRALECQIYSLSDTTLSPHPEAAVPAISADAGSAHEPFVVQMDVCHDLLVWSWYADSKVHLRVYNWKSGIVVWVRLSVDIIMK